MSQDDRLSLYEKMYAFEHDRHFKLNGVIYARIASLPLPVAAIAWLAQPISLSRLPTPVEAGLASLLVLATVALYVSVALIVASIWKKDYGYLPTPAEWDTTYSELRTWHAHWSPYKNATALTEGLKADFREQLIERYVEMATFSSKTNDTKSKWFEWSTRAFVLSVFFLGIALPASLAVSSTTVNVSQTTQPKEPAHEQSSADVELRNWLRWHADASSETTSPARQDHP